MSIQLTAAWSALLRWLNEIVPQANSRLAYLPIEDIPTTREEGQA